MQQAAVDFSNVTFRYPGAATTALEGVTLSVGAGERLGILGPNGGGKSTLIKLMLGLLEAQQGTVRVCGMPPREARRAGVIGYVAQRMDAELALPVSVREIVTLGAAWRVSPFSAAPKTVRGRVEKMLALTGAEAFADRPVGKLSGGQMQRAMIARALAADAKVLALDEPTVGIDAPGQQMFADLLARIHRELGVTIMVVSHDLRAIVAGSDRVACLARRLHSHTSPQGLTPQVLAELFSHDVVGMGAMGGPLAGMHVHAHGADEPCADEHGHGHSHSAPAAGPIGITVEGGKRGNA